MQIRLRPCCQATRSLPSQGCQWQTHSLRHSGISQAEFESNNRSWRRIFWSQLWAPKPTGAWFQREINITPASVVSFPICEHARPQTKMGKKTNKNAAGKHRPAWMVLDDGWQEARRFYERTLPLLFRYGIPRFPPGPQSKGLIGTRVCQGFLFKTHGCP